MPPEILALIDKPVLLIDKPVLLVAILFVGAMIGIGIEKFVRWDNRRKWQRRQVKRGKVVPFDRQPPAPKVPDAADQLRTVMRADFKAQPLLNKSEARVRAHDCPQQSLR